MFLEIKKNNRRKKKTLKEGLDFKVISRKYSKSKTGRRRENSSINSDGLIWDEQGFHTEQRRLKEGREQRTQVLGTQGVHLQIEKVPECLRQ